MMKQGIDPWTLESPGSISTKMIQKMTASDLAAAERRRRGRAGFFGHAWSKSAWWCGCRAAVDPQSVKSRQAGDEPHRPLPAGRRRCTSFCPCSWFQAGKPATEKSRLAWLKWKETLSEEDDWLPEEVPGKQVAQLPNVDDTHLSPNQIRNIRKRSERITERFHLSALDLKGNLGGVTSTSGLSYKIPGRIGDSPIFGASLHR